MELANELEMLREGAIVAQKKLDSCNSALGNLLRDRPMKIIDPKYNGQPYGRSKKPLTGAIIRRWAVSVQYGEIWCQPMDPWYPSGLALSGLQIVEKNNTTTTLGATHDH